MRSLQPPGAVVAFFKKGSRHDRHRCVVVSSREEVKTNLAGKKRTYLKYVLEDTHVSDPDRTFNAEDEGSEIVEAAVDLKVKVMDIARDGSVTLQTEDGKKIPVAALTVAKYPAIRACHCTQTLTVTMTVFLPRIVQARCE